MTMIGLEQEYRACPLWLLPTWCRYFETAVKNLITQLFYTSSIKIFSGSNSSIEVLNQKCKMLYLKQRLDFSVEPPPLPVPQLQIGRAVPLQDPDGIELLDSLLVVPTDI